MNADSHSLSAFERTKLCDILFALPVIGWFVFSIVRDYPAFSNIVWSIMFGRPDALVFANLLAHVAVLVLILLLIGLLILRRPPIAKARGIWPRAVALLGSFLGVANWGLPRADLSVGLNIASAGLIFVGTGFAIYAVCHLGKSFSILPEARRLVTSGPFAVIRHPVYLGEELALAGVMLQFLQPWSFVLFAVQLGWQLTRMSYEERVLSDAFPEYGAYRSRTARLIPGLY